MTFGVSEQVIFFLSRIYSYFKVEFYEISQMIWTSIIKSTWKEFFSFFWFSKFIGKNGLSLNVFCLTYFFLFCGGSFCFPEFYEYRNLFPKSLKTGLMHPYTLERTHLRTCMC